MYTLYFLFAIASFGSFLSLSSKPGKHNRTLYILSTIAMSLTHAHGFFIWVSQFLSSLFLKDRTSRRALLVMHLIILPVLIVFLVLSVSAKAEIDPIIKHIDRPQYQLIVDTMSGMSQNSFNRYASKRVWERISEEYHENIVKVLKCIYKDIYLLVFIILMVRGLGKAAGKPDADKSEVPKLPWSYLRTVLALWLVCSILLPFYISRWLTPIAYTRFFFPAIIPFYLAISRGIITIRKGVVRWILITLIFLFAMFFNIMFFQSNPTEHWRTFLGEVSEEAKSTDVFILDAGFVRSHIRYYYSGPDAKMVEMDYDRHFTREDLPSLMAEIEGFDRVWHIRYHSRDDRKHIIKALKSEMRSTLRRRDEYIDIRLYEK